MIRFRMLGAVDLEDAEAREVRSVLRRPKLLALLGYLAAARPRGFHRRDTLVALLWPELDNAHARNALRQAVHSLREALGRDALVARGEEELGVNDKCVSCDVREFDAALEAGQAEPALALYRGGLLSGLHVSAVPEFERWLEEERGHLRQRASGAAQALSEEAQTAGRVTEAIAWARRLTDLSPFNETALRRLVELLDRGGDRAGAVRAYGEFERRLERDLEVEPSSETHALMREIRRRSRTAEIVAARNERATPAGALETNERSDPVARRPVAPRKLLFPVLALAVGGVLIGGSLLFRNHSGASRAEAARSQKRLVVLPFTNLGPAEDEYFADGIAAEITARLASIARLRVISGTSGTLYKDTKKTAREIGRELGADYVLEGSVRWEKGARGRARVRVTPQLVSASDESNVWAEAYDEPANEILSVQSDVARKVVAALDVTLLEPERRLVNAKPTDNLQAYDYYLRGSDYMRRGTEQRHTRAALQMFQKAVSLDPNFALAYGRLAETHSRMYWFYYDHSPDRLAQAKRAIDRAFELKPDLPEAHHALGTYYWIGFLDYDRALQELAIAEASEPNDAGVAGATAAVWSRKGNLREALRAYEKAEDLDPGSALVANTFAQTYDRLRDFARAEALYDRATALSPDWAFPYFWKASMYLRWQGNTAKARAVLDEAGAGVADQPLVLYHRLLVDMFDRRYGEALGRLSSSAPAVIADQFRFIPRAQLYAQIYGLMQRHDLARAYYDSARAVILKKIDERPDDPRLHSALGIVYAGLGRKEEAIKEGEQGVAILPDSRDAYRGYYRAWDLASIYAMVGNSDAAVDRLEYLLSIPGNLTVAWLRIDPTWDPLRSHPRFQSLISGE